MDDAPLMLSVSGLRGLVGRSLTPAVASRYAQAYGAWLKQDRGVERPHVVIGRDSRPSGPMVGSAVAAGLLAVGCRLTDLGIVTTPSVGIMIDHLGAAGGIVITASHNPIEWNGIKALDAAGVAPPPEQVERIIAAFEADAPAFAPVETLQPIEHDDSATPVHVERVLRHVDADRIAAAKLKVVIDSVHGAGGPAAALLCDRLGVDRVALYAQPTGRFPHPPEPTKQNLTELAGAVAEHGAHVGFAQDPDADRLAIVDEAGTYIGEEYSLALCARHVLGRAGRGAEAVANLSTSRMIDDIAAGAGATVHRCAVGEANVAKRMRAQRAVIGGEGNGGVIWPAVGYVRDSISTIALLLELMAHSGQRVSQLVASIRPYAILKHKVDIRPGMADAAVAALAEAFADQRIDTQDGIRIDTEGGWLHVRPSNTEPILRIIAEAADVGAAQAMVDRASRIIERA